MAKSWKWNQVDSCSHQEETQQRTEEALRELFQHVHNMPESAKKKQLIRQVAEGRETMMGLWECDQGCRITREYCYKFHLILGSSWPKLCLSQESELVYETSV